MTSLAVAVNVRAPGSPSLVTSASDAVHDTVTVTRPPGSHDPPTATDGPDAQAMPARRRLSATTALASALATPAGLRARRRPGADPSGVLDVGVGRGRAAERDDQPEQQQQRGQQDDHLERPGIPLVAAARRMRASERQRASGQQLRRQYAVWPGNAMTSRPLRLGDEPFDRRRGRRRDGERADREHPQDVGGDGDRHARRVAAPPPR